MSTDKKTIIVTGVTSGIGEATAQALLAAGKRVVGVGRRADRLEKLRSELSQGSDFLPIAADICDLEEAQRAVDQAIEWSGGIDGLVNNAGVSRGAPNEISPIDDIRMMLDTNVLALINLTKLATPALRKSQGTIINISSTAVLAAVPGGAAYSASKAAVATFSECLRKELCNDNVRVAVLYPGLTDTELFDAFDETMKKQFDAMKAGIEVLRPADVANVIAFVLDVPQHVSLNEIVIRPTKQAL